MPKDFCEREPASDDFIEAMISGGTTMLHCECGRVHFAGDNFNEGEQEDKAYYEKMHKEAPGHYVRHEGASVFVSDITANPIPVRCPCNLMGHYERFILGNTDRIIDYLQRRAKKILEAGRQTKDLEAALDEQNKQNERKPAQVQVFGCLPAVVYNNMALDHNLVEFSCDQLKSGGTYKVEDRAIYQLTETLPYGDVVQYNEPKKIILNGKYYLRACVSGWGLAGCASERNVFYVLDFLNGYLLSALEAEPKDALSAKEETK